MEETDKGCLPPNIVAEITMQTAVDNNDLVEKTLDGKHKTHTTLVLHQRKDDNDCNKMQGDFGNLPTAVLSQSRNIFFALPWTEDFGFQYI